MVKICYAVRLSVSSNLGDHNAAAPKARTYDSQGQALSGAKRVAPGQHKKIKESTESAKYHRTLFRSFRASRSLCFLPQGRRTSLRSVLAPGYHISRRWRYASSILAVGQPNAIRTTHSTLVHFPIRQKITPDCVKRTMMNPVENLSCGRSLV